MNENILSTEQLSYRYKLGQKPALDGITMQIERGSCAAIIGVTGSGKSTLVQHFNGLLRAESGKVEVDGLTIGPKGRKGSDDGDLVGLRQRVGLLFQFPEAQLFEQTVFADVAFGPRRMHLERREIRTRVRQALEMVGMPMHIYGQRSPFELSGGQMRRVALAGVLAMLPKVLILDEPTVGLDAEGRSELYACIERLQREQGVTVVLVSHDMAEVATLASQLFVLYEGQLVIQGAPRSVFAHAEALLRWGLLPPPLNELLALLRQRGLVIPEEVDTLDEAFVFLSRHFRARGSVR